jgi:L-alanine-DL-glutamate epimerase-like enolase superfamily enzyme
MRIVSLGLEALEVPFREPFQAGAGRRERQPLGLLTVRTDEGHEGIAEWPLREGPDAGLPARLADALAGVDPDDRVALGSALARIGGGPSTQGVRGAVDSAVVELLARAGGLSVASWLAAAPRDEVALNALLGIDRADRTATEAQRLVASGYRCLKLKGGREDPGALFDRVSAVRAAVGPDVALRIDLNGTLEGDSALAVLGPLAACDLEYVEQPLAPEAGVAALATLRRRSPVPIAADESVRDLATARALLLAEAADVLVVKPARVGGLREAKGIIELAQASGASVTVSTLFESGVGIAGALHLAATVAAERAHGLATASLFVSDLLVRPLAIASGRMAVPSGLGLGVALDRSAVERFRVA